MPAPGETHATILVVDDNVILAQGFARALTLAGYKVVVAHSADVALREAQTHHPDAIILDFQMPFVNGVGFLYRMRALESLQHTPVLVITGASLSEEVRDSLRELSADVRFKPIGIADLVAATRSLTPGVALVKQPTASS